MAELSPDSPHELPALLRRFGARGTGLALATGFLAVNLALLGLICVAGLAQIESLARERLNAIALSAAALVDPVLHESLTQPAQTGTPEYEHALGRLVDLHNRLPVVQWIYTMRIVDGKLFFVLDTAQSPRLALGRDGAGASRVMDPVTEFSLDDEPTMMTDLQAGRVHLDSGTYPYAGRLLRSAEAPVIDANGQLVAILGVDVDIADFDRERSRFLALIGAAAAIGLGIAVALGVAAARLHARFAGMVTALEHESTTDSLTGLANRGHFTRWMETVIPQSRRQGRALAVLIFDIDHFKRVNDTLGHPAGDEVLRVLGARLGRVVRGGEICCRIGGEEFAVIMPGGTADDAEQLYLRLSAALREPINIAGSPLLITISAGIAELPMRDGNEADLMRAADTALYAAKAAGRDRVVRYGPT